LPAEDVDVSYFLILADFQHKIFVCSYEKVRQNIRLFSVFIHVCEFYKMIRKHVFRSDVLAWVRCA